MKSMEKWNKIVEQYEKNINSKENVIQDLWEQIFSQVLGFSKILGFLESQKVFSIGSSGSIKPDIILKDKIKEICAIELKQECIPLNSKIENQLFSYLKQTKISVGVVICDKIHLYAYEYIKDDNEQLKMEIEFKKDNPDGEKFIELFSFENFCCMKIFEFVNQKNQFLEHVSHIKSQIDVSLIKKLLIEHFKGYYSLDEINNSINDMEFIINHQTNVTSIKDDAASESASFEWNLDYQILLNGGRKSSKYIREYLISINYIDDKWSTTIAKINKDSKKDNKRYWANPPIDYLKSDWLLVLNDVFNRKIHIFKIPKYSLSLNEIKMREKDNKKLIDIEIINKDNKFICIASKIEYDKWYIETINY